MRRLLASLILATTATLSACGGTSAPQAATASSTKTAAATSTAASPAAAGGAKPVHIDFGLDGPYVGWYAPFWVAQQQGDYRRAGLDVSIAQGKGSVTTAQQVGNGDYDLAFCDVSAAATAITKGVPITVVAVLFQKSPLAVIYPAAHPIAKPADLVGKTIAASPGSTSAELFPALLAANHIQASQVKMVSASSLTASVAAIVQRKVDGVVNFSDYAIPLMEAQGVQLGSMSFADNGLPLMSEGIIVNNGYLSQHAGVVQRFVTASLKGWAYAVSHPKQTVRIQQQALGQTLPGALGELTLSLPLLQSAATRGHPLGWMSQASWKQTLDTLQTYEKLGQIKPLADYYTNRFIPAQT